MTGVAVPLVEGVFPFAVPLAVDADLVLGAGIVVTRKGMISEYVESRDVGQGRVLGINLVYQKPGKDRAKILFHRRWGLAQWPSAQSSGYPDK